MVWKGVNYVDSIICRVLSSMSAALLWSVNDV